MTATVSDPAPILPERAASPTELSILNHPDQRTTWTVVMTATLDDRDPDLPDLVASRLRALADQAPILRARWRGGRWHQDTPPRPAIVPGDPLAAAELLQRFDLSREPPVRLVIAAEGSRLALAAHHAALDGRGMLAVLAAVLGTPAPDTPFPPSRSRAAPAPRWPSLREPVRRLLVPADRVAPSASPPHRDTFVSRQGLALRPPNITGQIAAACVSAVADHNRLRGRPWRRVGLSIALGGPPAIGNVASYRRLDLSFGDDVAEAVGRGIRDPDAPTEMGFAPRALRLLAPVAERFGDSLLISNLGRTPLPGVKNVALYPVARGGSAVAVAASSTMEGRTTLSLRARDLSQADAESLLDAIAYRIGAGGSSTE